MKFGDYIKTLRISAQMTLRQFSREIDMDPSNWSKVERNIISIPQDPKLIERINAVLSLDTESAQELRDLADLSRGQIPADLRDDDLLAKMPAFFRAMRGQAYSQEDLDKLKQGVKGLHSK